MVKLLIFVFSTLILPSDQVSSQPRVSKCLQTPPDPNVSMTSTHGKWCYFVTNGSMNDTNEELELNFVGFKITKARRICAAEDATLLIIQNEQENKHLIQHYHTVAESLVLGLKQFLGESGYVYKWDDGSNVAFKPPKWDDQDKQTDITVLESGGGWKNTKSIGRHTVGVVCQQPLHLPSSFFAATTVSQTVCDFQDKTQFEVAKVFEYRNTKACFFIPKGRDEAANTLENGTGPLYIFNKAAARGICAQHNATLPSIHSIDEDNFMEPYMFLRNYSLGLKQVPVPGGGFEYKWEDGTDFDYQPVWLSKYHPASYIVSEYNLTGGLSRPREWHNIRDQEASIKPIRVICKQLYPPKPKPPVRNISICDGSRRQAHVYQNQSCYFVIWGATNMSNKYYIRGMDPGDENTVYFHFFPSIAREICQNEAATLPTISSEEEEKFIKEKFNPNQFTVNSGTIHYAEFIMLDLKQVKHVGDYQWTDNTPFSYEHPNWTNRAEYAYHTVMYLLKSKSEWENRYSTTVWRKPIGVLCKKPHFLEPKDTSTSEADTTKPTPTTITTSPSSPLLTLCDLGNTTDIKIVGVFKEGNPKACYFTVNGSIEEANKEQNGQYIFNITAAREICKRHNATLPSVQSIAEERFMLPFDKFPLGLKQVQVPGGYEYVWDDGSKFDYQPEWLTKYQPANYTVSAYLRIENLNVEILREWHNVLDNETFNQSIPVICKQSYPPTATSTPPAGKYISNCNDERKNNFAKTIIYGDQCYFVIREATNMTNELKRDQNGNFEYYIFYPSIAREICQNASATLPRLEINEDLFIVNNFGYHFQSDLFRVDGNKRAEIIMLDLKQVTNVSDYQWTDGTSLTYDPIDWDHSEKYAFFTTLSLLRLKWINMNSAAIDTPVGVLCKQPHVLTTTSEPTTSTTTTTSAPTTTPLPIRTVCDDNENTAHFKIVRKFEDKACYFIVNGIEEAANILVQQNGTDLYFFNITIARAKCAEYKATLPSIHSVDEDYFLHSQIPAKNFYSLGLQQVPVQGGVEFKWDDGSQFNFEPLWRSKFQPANFTVSLYTGTDKPINWHNALDQEGFSESIAVICKQSYPSKPKPPAEKISNCNGPPKHKFVKVEVFDDKWCYFVISEATGMTNKGKPLGNEFNPEKAREICQMESATLPTIPTPEEHKFIMKTFQKDLFKVRLETCTEQFCPPPRSVPAKMIMIDLKQVKNVTDYQWADNSPFLFKPKVWRDIDIWQPVTEKYAFFTAMNLEHEEWVNYDTVNIMEPIGVLCKQPHFPEPDTTSTEATTSPPLTEEPPHETTEPEPESPTPEPESPGSESPTSTQPPPATSFFPKPKPESNKCLPENSQYYKKVAKSGENFCYFVVKGSMEFSNSNNDKNAGFVFSPTAAETQCKQHGGDLPILFNKEDEFILDNFFDFSQSGVALGLKGEVDDSGGMEVKWKDGAELAYFKPDHWITKMGKIDFGFMYRTIEGGIEWKPGTTTTFQEKPVGVVCQQVISSGNRLIKPMLIFPVVIIFMMK